MEGDDPPWVHTLPFFGVQLWKFFGEKNMPKLGRMENDASQTVVVVPQEKPLSAS